MITLKKCHLFLFNFLPGVNWTNFVLFSSGFIPNGMQESGNEGAPTLYTWTSDNLTSKEWGYSWGDIDP